MRSARLAPAMISTLGHRVPRRRQRGAPPGPGAIRPGSTLIEEVRLATDSPPVGDELREMLLKVVQRLPRYSRTGNRILPLVVDDGWATRALRTLPDAAELQRSPYARARLAEREAYQRE